MPGNSSTTPPNRGPRTAYPVVLPSLSLLEHGFDLGTQQHGRGARLEMALEQPQDSAFARIDVADNMSFPPRGFVPALALNYRDKEKALRKAKKLRGKNTNARKPLQRFTPQHCRRETGRPPGPKGRLGATPGTADSGDGT